MKIQVHAGIWLQRVGTSIVSTTEQCPNEII